MMRYYTRDLKLPKKSFFLFGPRGTGKTTWLRKQLKSATWFDLLRTQEMLRLMRSPNLFRQQVKALPSGSWVVIDEIQRLPSLLNEVHAIISETSKKYKFVLTGSSARKLKRSEANMLAGRAVNRSLFPLTCIELEDDFDLENILRFGCLPGTQLEKSARDKRDLLEAYVANYIREEIKEEALVRNLESFSRFLEVAALANAQITNIAGVARDAAVSRPTVQGYFSVLIDTLIGYWLPAWRPKAKIKEVSHAKFYLFDTGVVRGLTNQLREPIARSERGYLLETYLLHELRAFLHYQDVGGELSFWRTPSGGEVDFIWSTGKKAIGIEVEASSRWRSEYSRSLKNLLNDKFLTKGFGVYEGEVELKDGPIQILPVRSFLDKLNQKSILT